MQQTSHQNPIASALKYIEANLSEKLSIQIVSEYVAISPFHFQRLFFGDLGESFAGYVRRRRLEQAANAIVSNTQISIIQIALECGFETHSSFSKAFKQQFGMTPSKFANGGALSISRNSVDSRPFLKSINKREFEMEVDYLELPTMWLQYRQQKGVQEGVFFPDRKIMANDFSELLDIQNENMFAICGAYMAGPKGYNDNSAIGYYGGIFHVKPKPVWSDNIEKIEAGRWAVFAHYGSFENLHMTWNKACRNWLPNNNQPINCGWMFETYSPLPGISNSKQLSAQIYIPLIE